MRGRVRWDTFHNENNFMPVLAISSFIGQNPADVALVDAIARGKLLLCDFARRITGFDLRHLPLGQKRFWRVAIRVSPASTPVTARRSSFDNGIPIVGGVSSFPKMARIYARRIVAGVANAITFWHHTPIGKNPSCPVRLNGARRDSHRNHSVTLFGFVATPQPAVIALHDLAPKPRPKRIRKTKWKGWVLLANMNWTLHSTNIPTSATPKQGFLCR